jgi:hypothetical protein
VTAVCHAPDDAGRTGAGAPPAAELIDLAATAPPMTGLEYLNADVLAALWTMLDTAFGHAFAKSARPLQVFLHDLHPAWSVVGRVHFNLAEYKLDPETPFAFLATYTTSLSASGAAQHSPLGRALTEYAGAANRPGARLDREPGLLFTLRQVKEGDLIGDAGARAALSLVSAREGVSGSRRIADESSLSAVFGIDVATGPTPEAPADASSVAPPGAARGRKKKKTPVRKMRRRRPANDRVPDSWSRRKLSSGHR